MDCGIRIDRVWQKRVFSSNAHRALNLLCPFPLFSIWTVFRLTHVHSLQNMAKNTSYSAYKYPPPRFDPPKTRGFARPIKRAFVTSSRRNLFVFFCRPLPHSCSLLSPVPSFSYLIDNHCPSCSPVLILYLLTSFFSSSKQTDFRNVASSRPYLRHSLVSAPTRRRRRRHLSYMRRSLHVQQQNRTSDHSSPCIQQSSDPHFNRTPSASFAISPSTPHYCTALENKTYYSCYSSLTKSSSYVKRSYSSLQKAKQTQMRRCAQSDQALCTSPKGRRPHNSSPWSYLKREGEKGPQAHIPGQRHDRRVTKTSHDSRSQR